MQPETNSPPQLFKLRYDCTTCPHWDKVDWCKKFETHVSRGFYCTQLPNL